MSFDYRNPKQMHKLTAHFGAHMVIFAGALLLAGAGVGCGDDDSGNAGAGGSGGAAGASGKAGGGASGKGGSGGAGGMCSASSGGPVPASEPDKHCIDDNDKKQEVNESACPMPADAAIPSEDDGGVSDFGPTLKGSEGDDDDCKYHLKWTTTCITENTDFTVTVTITDKVDGKPVVTTPGKLDYELYLESNGDAHLAPNTNPKYRTTSTPGTYTLGPLRVDKAGEWTLRFHIRPDCVDLTEDSPHGHAAFFVKVP
jgi:hypothetical protein